MRHIFAGLALLLLLAVPAAADLQLAKLYKWVDKYGNISYQDRPPPPGSGYVEEKDVQTSKGKTGAADASGAAQKSPVVLYLIPQCSSCDLARAYLQKRKVPFAEKNIKGDFKLQEELKAKAGELSVPVILIGEKVLKGYTEAWLESELDQVGYPKLEQTAEKPADNAPPSTPPQQ